MNRVNDSNAIVEAIISQQSLEKKQQEIIKAASKDLKIDGFRKGHVPVSAIKARYGKQLEEDTHKECIQDLLQDALKELDLETSALVGDPRITKFNTIEEGIEVEIKIGLVPTVPLESVEGCVPKVEIPEVTEQDIENRINEIATARAPLVSIDDSRRKLKNEEYAKIDFEGFIDGQAFDGGKAENYLLHIGSKSFIEGFEEQLIGMRKGEEREISVNFPEDYQSKNLAGKPAIFKVKLHEIQTKGKIEIDDNFAKTLFPNEKDVNVEVLKQKIKEQLQMEKKREMYNKESKLILVDNLDKAIVFDLPQTIVEQEMNLIFRNIFSSFSKEEQEELLKNQEALNAKIEENREQAQKSVKITFIIDAIARRDQIVVSDNEVVNAIYYEAMAMGQDPKAVLEYYQANNLIPAVRMAMLEDRVLTNLLEKGN